MTSHSPDGDGDGDGGGGGDGDGDGDGDGGGGGDGDGDGDGNDGFPLASFAFHCRHKVALHAVVDRVNVLTRVTWGT